MGSERYDKEMIVTQVSVGGFGDEVTAKMLLDYLEEKSGSVFRCRLKTSSTPPDTYPEFDANLENIQKVNGYEKVEPHAFVHFVDPDSVNSAVEDSERGKLVICKNMLKVSSGPENPYRMNQRRRKTTPFKLSNVVLEIGLMANRDTFIVGYRSQDSGVDFLIDPFDRSFKFLFTQDVAFSFKGTKDHAVIKCNFKVEFSVTEVNFVQDYDVDYSQSNKALVFQLNSSPLIFYRTADDDIATTHPAEMLDDDDPWIRTTDFTPSGAIGRCNTYRVLIRVRDVPKVKKALYFLQEQRVNIDYPKTKLKDQKEPEFGFPLRDPFFFCIQFEDSITFNILFLVNSVLHRNIINQHQFTEKVFDLLRSQPEKVNVEALKQICCYRKPVYDGFGTLKAVQKWLKTNSKLIEKPLEQNDVMEVRRLVITPTKAYCLPPEVELSNRVLRHYKDVSNRFLRVTFKDEGMKTLNNHVLNFYPASIVKSSFIGQKTTMFRRVKKILTEGFYLCGRRYCFLTFSANQLRDRSAWFFAENEKITCKDITTWMGKFEDKNVAKCAARMGQCFSSTYATVEVPRTEVDFELEDIKRNGYTFSDGIGKISPKLAFEVAEKLQLTENQPCAYQIRYAGCKGVVVWWPDEKDDKIKLRLRRSMNKFESDHTVFEVCSWTRLQPGFLNRQIITLLSALNVKDEIFWNMQFKMVKNLNEMIENADVAYEVITSSCAESGNTPSIMLGAGFDPRVEPHLRGMLSSIRAAQLEDLREKSRIFVENGRWLMGCLDELAVLENGQCFIQVSSPSVESCFAKHGSKFETKRKLTVIEGTVVIAKNPCLHPGDIRVLKAVNVPGLGHLFDCLIFPQKGDRPHTDEASGSDLDGDLYFVTWDENLIPPSKESWPPMEYTPAEASKLTRPVRVSDIIEFFTKNMVNDSLGTICNAHVVHADRSDYGALDENCIKLAELAATAVDFPKTGKIVNMPHKLRPKEYPDFMGKEPFQTYISQKILGKLYRQILDFYDTDLVTPSSEHQIVKNNIPYDKDLEILESGSFLNDSWDCKVSYDRQLTNLLGQYKVSHEEEIVTGHIYSMPKHGKKQGEMKERIKQAYSGLRKEFRKVFDFLGPEFDQISEEERNGIFERKASAWYQVTYHPIWVKKSLELLSPDKEGEMVNLSFAWIAADYLARIKIKRRGKIDGKSCKPIDSLGRYLSERI